MALTVTQLLACIQHDNGDDDYCSVCRRRLEWEVVLERKAYAATVIFDPRNRQSTRCAPPEEFRTVRSKCGHWAASTRIET